MISMVKRLRRNCNPGFVIWQAYVGIVYSHMVLCLPVICDISVSNFKKLERLDRVAQKWANMKNIPSLQSRLDKSCVKIVKKISCMKEERPLSVFFLCQEE